MVRRFHTAVLSALNSEVVKFLAVWLTAQEESVNSEGPLSKYHNNVAVSGGERKGKRG